jgi:hypothetical protein
MDWNWFFSTLSQSAAAIVGLLGAFIITKILSNQTTFLIKEEKIKRLLSESERHVENAGALCFNRYNKQTSEIEFKELMNLLKKEDELTAEGAYEKLNFSPFISKASLIVKISEKINNYKIEQQESLKINGSYLCPIRTDDHVYFINNSIREKGESINLTLREIKSHIRDINNLYLNVKKNPESSSQINYSLLLITLLFFVGVIYPLVFLPAPVNGEVNISLLFLLQTLLSFKGALLVAVSTIFCLILILFAIVNIKMKYNSKSISQLKKFSEVSSYSKYFQIMTDNLENKKANEAIQH